MGAFGHLPKRNGSPRSGLPLPRAQRRQPSPAPAAPHPAVPLMRHHARRFPARAWPGQTAPRRTPGRPAPPSPRTVHELDHPPRLAGQPAGPGGRRAHPAGPRALRYLAHLAAVPGTVLPGPARPRAQGGLRPRLVLRLRPVHRRHQLDLRQHPRLRRRLGAAGGLPHRRLQRRRGPFFALPAIVWARWFRRSEAPLADALAFAALWLAQEAFRGWFLTGFPGSTPATASSTRPWPGSPRWAACGWCPSSWR